MLLALTLLTTLSNAVFAATLSSIVDRNTLSINETLTLTVIIDEEVNTSSLNLSPLNENFEILGASPQVGSSSSTINGKTTSVASTRWTISLKPKREGTLVIPALTVNGAESTPINVSVNESKQTNSSNLPLEVSVTLSADEVYPSQQLIVELELSAAADVRSLNGSPLLINGAETESLGQRTFQRVDNGVVRQVINLKYAIFAKDPGEIVIPIMTFTGLQGGQRSFFGDRGKQVSARTKQMTVSVLDIPKDKTHPWFPADNVTITSTWSTDKSELQTGAPVTRTITITAQGQTATAIPPLSRPSNPETLKSYKDKAKLESQPTEYGFVSTRIESEALVANSSGKIIVPELKVNWWNVKTKQWEVVSLAAETLTVSGSAVPIEEPIVSDQTSSPRPEKNTHKINWLWPLLSAGLALICLIQAGIIFKLSRVKRSKTATITKAQDSSEKTHWQALNKSLKNNDMQEVRKDILSWAASALADDKAVTLKSLRSLAKDSALSIELKNLEESIYHNGANYNTASLAKPLEDLRATILNADTPSNQSSTLAPLYKS